MRLTTKIILRFERLFIYIYLFSMAIAAVIGFTWDIDTDKLNAIYPAGKTYSVAPRDYNSTVFAKMPFRQMRIIKYEKQFVHVAVDKLDPIKITPKKMLELLDGDSVPQKIFDSTVARFMDVFVEYSGALVGATYSMLYLLGFNPESIFTNIIAMILLCILVIVLLLVLQNGFLRIDVALGLDDSNNALVFTMGILGWGITIFGILVARYNPVLFLFHLPESFGLFPIYAIIVYVIILSPLPCLALMAFYDIIHDIATGKIAKALISTSTIAAVFASGPVFFFSFFILLIIVVIIMMSLATIIGLMVQAMVGRDRSES